MDTQLVGGIRAAASACRSDCAAGVGHGDDPAAPQFAPPTRSPCRISRYDGAVGLVLELIACGEHTGTHFDAPIHCHGQGLSHNATHNIPVDRFIGPACVIDVAAEAKANPDFLLTREVVEAWENKNGRIPAHSWVLVRTDWSHRKAAKEFLNAGPDGSHTPGFHPQCVPFLAKERDILGVGVETVGTDAGQAHTFDPMFPCHTIMHGSNRFGLASLTHLDKLPATGAS